jgi:ubiquinone/menaquinone biosynthesis C-methylase UbiE
MTKDSIFASSDRNNHFLSGGAAYAASRPTYPAALADALVDRCVGKKHALDVGCGSGQLSVLLADRFDQVTATDPSEAQIKNVTKHQNVTYQTEPAERIGLPDASIDLITAAQAAHWFDLDAFYSEVRRVARPDSVLALISYGVPRMEGDVGDRLSNFYWRDIHRHWPEGRRHVEEGYQNLAFPFAELPFPVLWITRDWTFVQLVAYVRTWSAAKRAITAGETAIIDGFIRDLGTHWKRPEKTLRVTWPLVGRLARIHD